jgi:hypothetical protein
MFFGCCSTIQIEYSSFLVHHAAARNLARLRGTLNKSTHSSSGGAGTDEAAMKYLQCGGGG